MSTIVGTYGQLILSEPRIACEEITTHVRDRIVLVDRYNMDQSCPYEQQAFILDICFLLHEYAQRAGALSVVLMDNEYREGMLFPSPMNMTIAEQVSIWMFNHSGRNSCRLHIEVEQ